MRRRLALALPAAALVFGAAALPAAAATVPTTPAPSQVNPADPPYTMPPQALGHAVGDAGAAVGDVQVFPGLVDTSTILPGEGATLPKQPLFEGGLGLSSAQVNSEALLAYERSVAESSPIGGAFGGSAPKLPGSLSQTALPDNPQATTGGLNLPKNPLLNVGLANGSVHARYSEKLGPCVDGPISDASTSTADISAVNLDLPSLTDVTKPLSDALNPAKLASLPQNVQDAVKTPASAGGVDPSKVLGMVAPNTTTAPDDGGISLLSLPGTISSHSTVSLVPLPNSKKKAVKSTSTFQFADVTLLKGTPLATQLKVASQPTLTVTSTGKQATSTVDYKAPAFEFDLPGQAPVVVDAQHPFNAPMALPLPNLIPANVKQQFQNLFKVPVDALKNVPVVGQAAQFLMNASNQTSGLALDLGVLRLSIGQLAQTGVTETKGKDGAPFSGFQLGATASMLHVDVLPLDVLKLKSGPSAVATLDFGKQVARAYTPTNGVDCSTPAAVVNPPAKPKPQATPKPPLAYTDAAYQAVPIFWTGTGLLLLGAVLLAALPKRRAQRR